MSVLGKLIFGYVLLAAFGFLLLALPIFHQQPASWTDDLFVAISAISTTGLTPFALNEIYNFGGQVVVLLLIQVGGIGYMSLGALAMLLVQHRWNPEENELVKTDLSLPNHYNLLDLLKVKLLLALVIETIGAAVLYHAFYRAEVPNAHWQAIFHSVSAFCTAGMSLFSKGLEGFTLNPTVSITISLLSYIGAVGFIVFADLWQWFRKKRKQLSYTSRLILKYSLMIILVGTVLVSLLDLDSSPAGTENRLVVALFHVVSASSTAGFDTINIGSFHPSILLVFCALMVIGASPTGTGGGLKVTTLAIVLAHLRCSFGAMNKVVLRKVTVPGYRVRLALAAFSLYVIAVALTLFLLSITERIDVFALMFESISAFSTVGLSMGATPELSDLGKIIISLAMFVGRIGMVTFGLVLFMEHRHIALGKSYDVAL